MSDNLGITVGTQAPEFSLPASTGVEIALANFYSKKNVYLFFVREYNWMQCRSHAAQLGRLYKEFQVVNYEILLILGAPIEKAKAYAESLHLPYPVLADPERNTYRHYGLEKTLIFIQRTASVVLDRNGIIRYMKSATNPIVWLQESQEILNFIKSMPVTGG